MKWKDGRRSSNIEDRRGRRISRGKVGGGIGTIILILIGMYFGIDPSVLMDITTGTGDPQVQMQPTQRPAGENRLADFVSVVLADTEDTWQAIFRQSGKAYPEPRLVLFTDTVQSACGMAQSAMGPFYCPRDQKVYIDLGFYRDLQDRFGAPGDFAQAYVIAHEIGHHVQNSLGMLEKVHSTQSRVSQKQANALSVRLELQADCLAGIWAHHADRSRQILEQGDVEEALNAASAIGDDRLQRQTQGRTVPDSFTHGTSRQRVRWFQRGLQSGRFSQCDTFDTDEL